MRIYKTTDPLPPGATDQFHIYNALDCCITFEVFEAILPQLDEVTSKTYEHAKALQGPVLEMELRGTRVDITVRDDLIVKLLADARILEDNLQEILVEGVGIKIENPLSPKQLAFLLYEVLGLPVQRSFKTKSPSVDRKALEKLCSYFHAAPIVNHVLAIRDLHKKVGMLRSSIDSDSRIRTSFNIAGTATGRFSSRTSAANTGTNVQTVTPELRRVFIADPGMKLAYIDLEQAESRGVGAIEWNLFGDPTYLDACESSDLHTRVTQMCWEDLGWTGDLKLDKAIAKQIFYRDVDYRQGAKKLGHASNYLGKPPEIAKQTGIPLHLVSDFQPKYMRAFPAHQKWHDWVKQKLIRDGFITTFMGRRRFFFGRRWDQDTVKAAVAYEPQSSIRDYLSKGILRVWHANICELLLDMHDAILIQYPEELESEVVPRVQKLLEIEVPLMNGRTLVIPTEAMVGWNWSYAFNEKKELVNVNGLVPFGDDKRVRSKPESILDRLFSQT